LLQYQLLKLILIMTALNGLTTLAFVM